MRGAGRWTIVAAAVGCAVALAGCTAQNAAAPAPTQTAWTVQPGAAPGDAGTAYDAKASVAENQQAFDSVIQTEIAKNPTATGQDVTAALEAAGFAKPTLQYSASKTSANLMPGSIMVSAQLGSSCLIGQWGSEVGGYHSAVAPALESGGCLVGGGGTGTTPKTPGSLAN